MYSRFQKGSTPPRVLTIIGSAVALALACLYEIDSEDGTYTPSIIMLSLMWLAPGLIAVGLDLLFMLYALATLIVVSLPLGKNTTLKNMWIPVIFSISSVAGHWMKEKANVKENMQLDIEDFKSSRKWFRYSIYGGIVVFITYFVAWVNSNDDNLFWGIGLVCVALCTTLFGLQLIDINRIIDNEFFTVVKTEDYQIAQQQMKGFLDYDFDHGNTTSVQILTLALAMASTVFVGARLAKAEYSVLSIVALLAWIFAIFSIHRAKKYFEDYYVYKKY